MTQVIDMPRVKEIRNFLKLLANGLDASNLLKNQAVGCTKEGEMVFSVQFSVG
jgi:hypothetical protein